MVDPRCPCGVLGEAVKAEQAAHRLSRWTFSFILNKHKPQGNKNNMSIKQPLVVLVHVYEVLWFIVLNMYIP